MKKLLLLLFFLLLAGKAFAAFEEEVEISTHPIGSPFYRHLAHDLNLNLRELVKFEKKGFGRTEICTIVLLSSATNKPLKDYGKRRLKDGTSLEQFANEAHLNYQELNKEARRMKEEIEARGETNLPPPIFEPQPTPSPTPEKKKKKKEKEKDTKNDETP